MALDDPVGPSALNRASPASGPEVFEDGSSSPSLRILTVGNMYPPHHAGGYELMWQTVVRRARQLGHRVRVLTSDYRIPAGPPEIDADVHRTLRWYWDLERYEFPELDPLARLRVERSNARELDRHLAEFRPDVVSWWSMGCMSLSLIERARRASIPAIFIVHDDWLVYGRHFDQWIRMWQGRRRLLAPLAERLLRLPTAVHPAEAGRFVFNSRYTHDAALRAGVRPSWTKVIHPGIELSLQKEPPRKPWRWQLLYIGRIDHQKGIDTAVQALARLPAKATLDVWGTGNERYLAELRSLAQQLEVAERVRFHGWAGPRERIRAYADADVVVFPVRWEEPFGLVPLEAMAVERLVVSTARGGTAEFLRRGNNALVFEPDDAAALADAVSLLASDTALRERLLQGGRETAARYTLERFAEDTVREIVDAARTLPKQDEARRLR
jgi:glycogen(starch) synthase